MLNDVLDNLDNKKAFQASESNPQEISMEYRQSIDKLDQVKAYMSDGEAKDVLNGTRSTASIIVNRLIFHMAKDIHRRDRCDPLQPGQVAVNPKSLYCRSYYLIFIVLKNIYTKTGRTRRS